MAQEVAISREFEARLAMRRLENSVNPAENGLYCCINVLRPR